MIGLSLQSAQSLGDLFHGEQGNHIHRRRTIPIFGPFPHESTVKPSKDNPKRCRVFNLSMIESYFKLLNNSNASCVIFQLLE